MLCPLTSQKPWDFMAWAVSTKTQWKFCVLHKCWCLKSVYVGQQRIKDSTDYYKITQILWSAGDVILIVWDLPWCVIRFALKSWIRWRFLRQMSKCVSISHNSSFPPVWCRGLLIMGLKPDFVGCTLIASTVYAYCMSHTNCDWNVVCVSGFLWRWGWKGIYL